MTAGRDERQTTPASGLGRSSGSRASAGAGCPSCGAALDPSATSCGACGHVPADPAARQLIGTVVLGVFEITDVLGQGGMSIVYKGRHKLTDQVVALKILPPELAAHGGLKARFLEEAKALARLEHPNIVRLYHFGEEAGRFVLAMQFVEGQTFERQILRAKSLPWRQAAKVTVEVLRALDYAHQRGVVHRDIKPSNILVRNDGSAMVMDFGIAKMSEGSTRLTATGQTMGTVRYMSPEQVRGADVDPRTDLYSLGATLYEALVGDTPFDGNTHFEIMTKHLNEAPIPPRQRGADCPADLETIVMKSLAKKPDLRFQDAPAFISALEEVLAGRRPEIGEFAEPTRSLPSPDDAPRPGTGLASSLEPAVDGYGEYGFTAPRRSRAGMILGLGGLVLAAAGGVAFFKWRADARPVETAPEPAKRWGEPTLVPEVTVVADRRFDGTKIRVITTDPAVVPEKVAESYQLARSRFKDHLRERKIDDQPAQLPLNIVVATPEVMCAAQLYAPQTVPENCGTRRYRFLDDTMYVKAGEQLLSVNVMEGAAVHFCTNTPALQKRGCNEILIPFWDAVEAAAD